MLSIPLMWWLLLLFLSVVLGCYYYLMTHHCYYCCCCLQEYHQRHCEASGFRHHCSAKKGPYLPQRQCSGQQDQVPSSRGMLRFCDQSCSWAYCSHYFIVGHWTTESRNKSLVTMNVVIFFYQGLVIVHVLEAKDLKSGDVNIMGKGKSDPYCTITSRIWRLALIKGMFIYRVHRVYFYLSWWCHWETVCVIGVDVLWILLLLI